MINLNDAVPAAPAGGVNVLFQEDVSGNVSAYLPTTGGNVKTTVGSVAGVLTIDASLGNSFLINVTENITSMSITSPTDGQEITLLWVEDATGSWTIVLATNLLGATAPTTAANDVSCQKFTYDVTATNWYATGVGVTGM